MVYNRTIADDNVVYQWVRREIRLASDNSWARHHLKHVSWRSRWIFFCIHLNSEWQVHAKSNELTDAFLACPPDWARGRPCTATRRRQSTVTCGCRTIVPVFRILFSRLSMVSSFHPTLVGKFTQQPSCTIQFWQIEIFKIRIPCFGEISGFCLIFTNI